MPALLKLLVLIAIFLLASNANAFTSLSLVAENQVWVNHWIHFQQPMSDPTNEPSHEPTYEPTKRMDLDAELPSNLSSKQLKYSLSPKQDAELSREITDSTNAQNCGLCHEKKSERVLLAARAKCLKPPESSCASKVVGAKCLKPHKSNCASKVARAKCLKPHRSSCASKVVAKCLKPHMSSCASLLVALAKCLNSNESSCASLLAVRAKPLKSNKTNNALSFSNKSASTLQLVVASVVKKFSNGSTQPLANNSRQCRSFVKNLNECQMEINKTETNNSWQCRSFVDVLIDLWQQKCLIEIQQN